MTNENKLVLEIWECVRDNLPSARREDIAAQLLRLFEEYGFDIDLADLEGEDSYLDKVIESLKDEDEQEISYDHEDDF